MTAFADLSDYIATLTDPANVQHIFQLKTGRVSGANAVAPTLGGHVSLWQYEGTPQAGAAPTTAAVPTRSTAGALGQANASGDLMLLGGLVTAGASNGVFTLWDRLSHVGSLSGVSTSAQTGATTSALTRNTTGEGNRVLVEIHTQIGTTLTDITASYTNQAGTASRTTIAAPIGGTGLREAQTLIELPLQAGDTGVRSVQSVTLAATTGTAGAFGVVIAKPIHTFSAPGSGTAMLHDPLTGLLTPQVIDDDACLFLTLQAGSVTIPTVNAVYTFANH